MSCDKVAWKVITLPKELGGLRIIDPWAQLKALLGKYVTMIGKKVLVNLNPRIVDDNVKLGFSF